MRLMAPSQTERANSVNGSQRQRSKKAPRTESFRCRCWYLDKLLSGRIHSFWHMYVCLAPSALPPRKCTQSSCNYDVNYDSNLSGVNAALNVVMRRPRMCSSDIGLYLDVFTVYVYLIFRHLYIQFSITCFRPGQLIMSDLISCSWFCVGTSTLILRRTLPMIYLYFY